MVQQFLHVHNFHHHSETSVLQIMTSVS